MKTIVIAIALLLTVATTASAECWSDGVGGIQCSNGSTYSPNGVGGYQQQ